MLLFLLLFRPLPRCSQGTYKQTNTPRKTQKEEGTGSIPWNRWDPSSWAFLWLLPAVVRSSSRLLWLPALSSVSVPPPAISQPNRKHQPYSLENSKKTKREKLARFLALQTDHCSLDSVGPFVLGFPLAPPGCGQVFLSASLASCSLLCPLPPTCNLFT